MHSFPALRKENRTPFSALHALAFQTLDDYETRARVPSTTSSRAVPALPERQIHETQGKERSCWGRNLIFQLVGQAPRLQMSYRCFSRAAAPPFALDWSRRGTYH